MNGKAKHEPNRTAIKSHQCDRHHDLTILLRSARKSICSTCFATLKKSHYNVIAGSLLELHYLHNVSGGLVKQNNIFQKQLSDQEEAILRLQTEISEIKNNGRNHEKPRPDIQSPAPSKPRQVDTQQPSSDTKKICATGHVAQVAHSLQDLLHLQITKVLQSWKKKKPQDTSKNDDLQDRKRTTHTHGGYSMK